mmetsp:Transcript_10003/g.33058  ORF Transcript_10003/g.33058 Transcript_10003/m.33058 type:complete len:246 (-) Transcript_10003:844-1581(-)
MLLQVARWMIKCLAAQAPAPAAPAVRPEDGAYLWVEQPAAPMDSSMPADLVAQAAVLGLAQAARTLAVRAAATLSAAVAGGMSAENAFSTVAGVELAEAGRAHARLLLAAAFYRAVGASAAPAPVVRVLWRLCALHAAGELCAHGCLPLLETGWLDPAGPAEARAAVSRLLADLRPDAVALVDAFGLSDWELSSVLGRHDGDVYTHLLAWARRSPLNRKEKMEAFEKHVRPLMGHEAAGSITSKL